MTVAQPPAKRPRTSSIRTGVAAVPDLKALKKLRSAILTFGSGQFSDELISFPSASNTLTPATSEWPRTFALQHLMHFRRRHRLPEGIGRRQSARADLRDDGILDGNEILELLIEVAGQQQHRIFQFAFGAVERALAENADHHRGADHDGRNQQHAAKDQPADRSAAQRRLVVERGLTFCRHGLVAAKAHRREQLLTLRHHAHGYRVEMEVTLGI